LNQNRNNLIVVDVESAQLDINFTKYFIQGQKRDIMPYFHGTCQQFINASDLNNLFSGFPIKFRRPKKDEDLTGKLLFNRVGKFGVDIHD
jgi:hypothetical protein